MLSLLRILTFQTIAVLLAITFTMFSCKSNQNGSGESPDSETPDNTGGNQGGLSLTYNAYFAEVVDKIHRDESGNIWAGRTAMVAPDAEILSFLEKRDSNGELVSAIVELGQTWMIDFTLLEDGSAVVAGFVDSADIEADYGLKLTVIDDLGKIRITRMFEDLGIAHSDDVDCRIQELDYGFYGFNSVDISSFDDQIVLVTYNCLHSIITVLDSDLNLIWSKPITTQRTDVGLFYGSESLHIAEDGTIITASKINESEVSSFNSKYHTNLVGYGKSDVIINSYSIGGDRLFSSIIGTANYDSCSDIVAHNNALYFAAEAIVDRPTSANKHQDDVWLAAIDLTTNETIWSKTFDIKDEDTVEAITVVDDRYLAIGGSTGRLQVPTGSIVKHGDAFILLADFSGEVIGLKMFGTARNDYVSSILDLGESSLMVSGSKDGPITHDGDKDPTQLHRFGYIETFKISDIEEGESLK